MPALDAYLESRSPALRRRSLGTTVYALRNFLRYLFESGQARIDLSSAIHAPKIYKLEGIPSALTPRDVTSVLQSARANHSPLGRRDYAILILLATYGLRAREVISLRLDDIDWRNDVLRVRHSKTNTCSELPLLRAPAEAILQYLKNGRPQTDRREVFLRAIAPYRPLSGAASLYHCIERYLEENTSIPCGRRGSHALRHARATTLLNAAVPLKTIGDILGHRSPRSTMIYLKWATKELRAISLELPS